jgi:23S rRNA pseudouridine1911/1915/1917 synthase
VDTRLSFVPRHMLHAHHIEFRHPDTNKVLSITAPLPSDFQEVLKKLRSLV